MLACCRRLHSRCCQIALSCLHTGHAECASQLLWLHVSGMMALLSPIAASLLHKLFCLLEGRTLIRVQMGELKHEHEVL